MKRLPTSFRTDSKKHVAVLHETLSALGHNIRPNFLDVRNRTVGDVTKRAIKAFQKKHGLDQTGNLNKATLAKLNEEAIRKQFESNRQIAWLHRSLIKAGFGISEVEVKGKQIGPATSGAIRAFQEKYSIAPTGNLDSQTLERLESVNAGKPAPAKYLKAETPTELRTVKSRLSLNMAKKPVHDLQRGLAFLGYKIKESEFVNRTFGGSTRKAVLAFQKDHALPQTGEFTADAAKVFNQLIGVANPKLQLVDDHRVKGSVRDELWQGSAHVRVQVFEKKLRGPDVLLAERKTLESGFYDLPYSAPKDAATGKKKESFHVVVRVVDQAGNDIQDPQTYFNVGKVLWANFTAGDDAYSGKSEFERLQKQLKPALEGLSIAEIQESTDHRDITHLYAESGVGSDQIMRLSLAFRVANHVGLAGANANEAVYAFLGQNLPPELPSDLLPDDPDEWDKWIDKLVQAAATGILILDRTSQSAVFDDALRRNLVSRSFRSAKEDILDELDRKRDELSLDAPLLVGGSPLRSLLDVSTVTAGNYTSIGRAFLQNDGLNTDFWRTLQDDVAALTQAQIDDLRETVDLGSISRNHTPTVSFLKARISNQAEPEKSVRDFAKLSLEDWVQIIETSPEGPPVDTDGETIQAKTKTFALTLKERSERLFPATALVAEVVREGGGGLTKLRELDEFLGDNPDLDIARDNVDKYLKDNAIEMPGDVRHDLQVVQRVHKVSKGAKTGTALLKQRLHSSPQIYFRGKDNVIESLQSEGVEPDEAARIFHAAEQQYALVLARLTEFRFDLYRVEPFAIVPRTYSADEIAELQQDVPNLETLFGSLDYCECNHCRSVYSPAAYLTDLLRFLGEKKSRIVGKSVREILLERRPDLGKIDLDCDNTTTLLPYIDLVNEILEYAVPPVAPTPSHQTTLSVSALRAAPEHLREAAYDSIKVADYPMTRILNLWHEQARVFLNHLGVPRHELMAAFQDKSDANAKAPSDASIAAEFFGLSPKEKDLILTSRPSQADQSKYWHFDVTQPEIEVSALLNRSRLSYRELLTLLQCRSVNPAVDASKVLRPSDNCDVNQQLVDNLTPEKLDRMHRFIRLWRRAGWNMWELDLLIRASDIGADSLDSFCLVNLQRFQAVQHKLKVSVEELLAFYQVLDTEQRTEAEHPDKSVDPIFRRLFLNKTVTNPLDPAFEPAVLPAGALDNHKSTILSALAISEDDFALLVGLTDGTLSIPNLSVLFRHSLLAKRLRLRIKDLLRLLNLPSMADPFDSPESTLVLIRWKEALDSSGLSLNEIEYLLTYSPESPVGIREEVIEQYIGALRLRLDKLKGALDASNETRRDQVANGLARVPSLTDQADIEKLLNLIEGTWTDSNSARLNFISEHLGIVVRDLAVANLTLTPAGALTEAQVTARYDYVALELYHHLSANEITEQVAGDFGLQAEHSDTLLTKLSLPGTDASLLDNLQSDLLLEKDDGAFVHSINAATLPVVFHTYRLLHKASTLVKKMKLEAKELSWLVAHYAVYDVVDLSSLPLEVGQSAGFELWLNLWTLLDFERAFPEPEGTTFLGILEKGADPAKPKAEIHADLATLTNWAVENVSGIDANLGFKHEAANLDYADPDTYRRMRICADQIRKTGSDADTLFSWANWDDEAQEATTASETKAAAKSKYEPEEWEKKVQPLEDELRVAKRDALVDYLLEHSMRNEPKRITFEGADMPNPRYWESANDLFGYYLIDVEMNACQLTSRIKQAISSTQLYVQRCFLNLEQRFVIVPDTDPDLENSWNHWKWMKNYRIWEANRKVFLYPENWIEPELRDDKSPFFQELENDLMQREITNQSAEAAFRSYLSKVNEVAQLEICGLFEEYDGPLKVLHVIGKTKSTPERYYYRSFDLNYSTWSAWERVEVDIQGEHVVPVVYNRRLYLFWLEFETKPLKLKKVPPAKPSEGPSDSGEPPNMLELKLGWSIREQAGWSAKRLSRQKLIHPWDRPLRSYAMVPRYKAASNTLWLDVYVSTSREFNQGLFFDQFKNDRVRFTRSAFNETYRPWHSSSFVFNGEVQEIKMRGIYGYYYLPQKAGSQYVSSYEYVRENYAEDARGLSKLTGKTGRLRQPTGMHFEYGRLANNRVHTPNDNSLAVYVGDTVKKLLEAARSPFELVVPFANAAATKFIFQDRDRAFFGRWEREVYQKDYQTTAIRRRFVFYPFYHPFVWLFIRELNRSGLDGLFNRRIQMRPEQMTPWVDFKFASYAPVTPNEPSETALEETNDFTFGGAYSLYNWELFFHAPLLIASRLNQNQRFEEAMQWYHYIFDPTSTENYPVPQRFWITKPFHQQNADDYRRQRIEAILGELGEHRQAVAAWKNNPFKPHLIARYRPVAYQRCVVMRYIDNLIDWGDQLFRRDSMESINEASQLYVLAFELLGRRPEKIPAVGRAKKTFDDLVADAELDEFGNADVAVQVEDTLPVAIETIPVSSTGEPLPRLETSYFCIPNNDKLEDYWDRVEDRLRKIRNCMNIEGIVRQLPLFEPPIDPALLVKAAAEGADFASVLDDRGVSTPIYRFPILVSKALEFATEVKSLGQMILSALEKRDAEGLSVLRALNEAELLEEVKEVRKQQIRESKFRVDSLEESLNLAFERKSYYGSREKMSAEESLAAGLGIAATVSHTIGTVLETVSSFMSNLPDFYTGGAGFGGSPVFVIHAGGGNKIAAGLRSGASVAYNIGAILDKTGALVNQYGSYERRMDDWKFQERLAEGEIKQIEKEIEAAKIRLVTAYKELQNHELQVENSKTEVEYLKTKYTNGQLYNWMLSQVSTVYFQAYQLAYDMAKRSEASMRRELGLTNSTYIQFGYWDSLKKGLTAGEKLAHDLRRMEAAYYDLNRREFEITKNVSLANTMPWCLVQLKLTGTCEVELPEWLFDMDYPGHYMRRIKSVSISVPAVTGPHTSINCTLSMLRSVTRISNLVGNQYEMEDAEDNRFIHDVGTVQSIATSHGMSDSGLFELSFSDQRYLPFEGSGAVSSWTIRMPSKTNRFDLSTVSDLIMHVRYTAREGGAGFADAASQYVDTVLPTSGSRLLSLRHQFPSEWNRFLHPAEEGGVQELVMDLERSMFPFHTRSADIRVARIDLVLLGRHKDGSYVARVQLPGQGAETLTIGRDDSLAGVHHKEKQLGAKPPALGQWSIRVRRDSSGAGDYSSLPEDDLDDILLLTSFETQ